MGGGGGVLMKNAGLDSLVINALQLLPRSRDNAACDGCVRGLCADGVCAFNMAVGDLRQNI